MPLSYDWSALKAQIDTLQPTGNTNQGIGMAWAWLTLGVGVQPFNAPAKDTGGDGESAVLKECASTSDKFYRITAPSKTVSVFNSIGQSLAKLRVYK